MSLRDLLKLWMPPIVFRLPGVSSLRARLQGGFWGDFQSYEEAVARCGGRYEGESITADALKGALETRAQSERAMVHDPRVYRSGFALLQARIALGTAAPFHVLDLGGGMGEHYFSLRRGLGEPLTWTVLETESMAAEGRKHLAAEGLRFASELSSVRDRTYQAILASGVLHYLPDPHRKFLEVSELATPYVILDRVPLIAAEKDRLTIQKVDPRLFRASFPAWFLSEQGWRKTMADAGWSVQLEWNVPEDAPYLDGKQRLFKGFALARKQK